MKIITFVCVICIIAILLKQIDSNKTSFEIWADTYNKIYSTVEEKQLRYSIWENNTNHIQKINSQQNLQQNSQQNSQQNYFRLKMNEFGDLTLDEFKSLKTGYISTPVNGCFYENSNDLPLPSYINWTERGVVTPVKNQYGCASCWAFSATGVVESYHAMRTHKLIDLSEENLIDCTFNYGNQGCLGGMPENALDYIIVNGVDTEKSYPLVSVMPFTCIAPYDCTCEYNSSVVGARINGYGCTKQGNETDLQYNLIKYGPISVSIDVTDNFQFYDSGILIDPTCSSQIINHSVLVVGYGELNGVKYYIIKNSWGTNWGMNGYVLLGRNMGNMCGIATNAIYVY